MFEIGDAVEIVKAESDWKGVRGTVVNYGTVGGKREYLVRNQACDLVPAGEFWWNESSLRRA